jgi:methionyl-tRNA formyltransferase
VSGEAAAGSVAAVRAVFFGSGAFAVPILDALLGLRGVEVIAAVSAPDRPVGRKAIVTPTPMTARARQLGLEVLQPARVRAPESVAAISRLRPELALLADYGQIIPQPLLGMPSRGFLNIHPSRLPRHRGAAPIPATILAGDTDSAVTLMVLTGEMDAGPIVAVEPVEVRPNDTAVSLEERAAEAGAVLLKRALPEWLAGRLEARAQSAEGVTYTRPLKREDGRLDPAASAEYLERHVRAYVPWPGSFVETPVGRLIVWRAGACSGEQGDDLGTIVRDGDGLALVAAGGGRLRLDEVQLAGRGRMSAAELRRGYPNLVGKAWG